MPVLANRIQETTTTGGTGTIALAGAVTGYRSFNAAFTIGDITYYTIDNGSGEWEIGVGTVGSGTLSRNSVLESSNANALVNFSAGTKRVFCSAPTKVLLPDQTSNSGKVLTTNGTDPSWTTTLNGITLGNITPGSGAFTTLSASSTVSGTGFSTYLASPPAIGGTTPAAGNFTTLGATGNVTLGDAAGDTLTINGTAVSIPNNLNFDSNTLFIDAANNRVGVGTSSPSGKFVVADAQEAGLFGVSSNTGGFSFLQLTNTGASGRSWQLVTSGSTGAYTGALAIYDATAGTERLRIDSSGNVGIGTSSPGTRLHVSGGITRLRNTESVSQTIQQWLNFSGVTTELRTDGNAFPEFGTTTGHPISFITNAVPRLVLGGDGSCTWKPNGTTSAMTLDASGNLLVGLTTGATGKITTYNTFGYGIQTSSGTQADYLNFGSTGSLANATGSAIYWRRNYDNVIQYSFDGAGNASKASGAGTWNAYSDSRLKTNVTSIYNGLSRIVKLNPCSFDYINPSEHNDKKSDSGFMADEFQEIYPNSVYATNSSLGPEDKNLVTAEDPAKMMGFNSEFYADLVSAIQELHAEIETLKQRIQ